jgi:2-oxoglutarate dehydrogenase E2 component (dihydrolipoamide succinyltransferase)
MKTEMVMPQMGESITEATVSRWLKKVGDAVTKDEIILEISTDKVDSEIPAPASGVIVELRCSEGDVVPVKTVIAIIDSEGKGTAAPAAASATPAAAPASAPKAVEAATQPQPAAAPAVAPAAAAAESISRFYSPLVMSLAQVNNISLAELETIAGSGQGGRVNKQDIMRHLDTRATTPTPAQPAPAQAATPAAAARPAAPAASKSRDSVPAIGEWQADGTKIIPMDAMRSAIAEHMVRSKATSPHVYSVQEVDVTNISKWRNANKKLFANTEGFNLSFTPFFLEATVRALVKFPHVNASVQDKKIILKRNVNLGCAVALENMGLIVPVIKRAEEKNFVGLARSLNDVANRARSKKLLPDDVSGGTFTVTNPGVFGTIIGTPIINQPQVAILCLGAIKKRPVVIDDAIAIREMCYLTLSYDHRIVDGMLGGQFLAFIREYLEGWDINRPLY